MYNSPSCQHNATVVILQSASTWIMKNGELSDVTGTRSVNYRKICNIMSSRTGEA
jgi:hypothetical protein